MARKLLHAHAKHAPLLYPIFNLWLHAVEEQVRPCNSFLDFKIVYGLVDWKYESECRNCRHHLIALAMIYMAVYSLPAHKEIRFLLPALQMCIPTTAVGLDAFLSSKFRVKKILVYSSVGTQILAFLFFALFHQRSVSMHDWCCSQILPMVMFYFQCRAQIDVMSTIRRIHDNDVTNLRVLFLTPCHATPYYSSIHAPITMRFFDCSPRGTLAAPPLSSNLIHMYSLL
jgi:hypothetical protein